MKPTVFVQLMGQYNFGNIKNIHCLKSDIYYDDIFLFEKIIIETEQFLIFSPIDDTDEVNIEIRDNFEFGMQNNILLYEEYNTRKIFDIKKCMNNLGYFDQYTIAFDGFNASFSIICELSLLGIFESKPINWQSK